MAVSDHHTIDVLCTLALRSVLIEIAEGLADAKGLTFSAQFQSSNALMQRIANGETADIAIITDTAIETLVTQGKIIASSRCDLAASAVGLAVRKGAPKPDISSADALKRTLLDARSIAFSQTGASGLFFADLIKRLGIDAPVRAKARIQDGLIAEFAANGDVEIAVQQISELMQVPGVDLIGPLPKDLQKPTVFSAGIFASAKDTAAASALIAWLSTPQTAAIITSKGLQPQQRPA
jgi:molybdate transport system substrate-binding protein